MLKQGLSFDTTFYPPWFSLDSTFKQEKFFAADGAVPVVKNALLVFGSAIMKISYCVPYLDGDDSVRIQYTVVADQVL
jgi:hypothetical protein